MIQIKVKELCCGCEACAQICPKQCILLREDNEGFYYPLVDKLECIDCGLCEKVCPVINQNGPIVPISVYASQNPNDQVRYQSSSGGIFTMLAKQVIDNGGVVFGACWNDNWEVVHEYTEKIEDLSKFRGSKYVQSKIGNSYKKAEQFLRAGRKVLFSGTPCQIAALKLFLKKEYHNLLTVDFICHGVPSPGVFRWYLQEELNQYAYKAGKNTVSPQPIFAIPNGHVIIPNGIDIEDIRFRDKRKGWKKYSFALELSEASVDGERNTVSLSHSLHTHPFLKGFLANLYLRPSCHSCPTKMMKSGSDITLADCWEIDAFYNKNNDDSGMSKIHVNTPRGEEATKGLNLELLEVPISVAMKNRMIVTSAIRNRKRSKFFEKKNLCFKERIAILTQQPFHSVLIGSIRGLIPKTLVNKLRLLKYKIKK